MSERQPQIEKLNVVTAVEHIGAANRLSYFIEFESLSVAADLRRYHLYDCRK
jgi:hypothetical protein